MADETTLSGMLGAEYVPEPEEQITPEEAPAEPKLGDEADVPQGDENEGEPEPEEHQPPKRPGRTERKLRQLEEKIDRYFQSSTQAQPPQSTPQAKPLTPAELDDFTVFMNAHPEYTDMPSLTKAFAAEIRRSEREESQKKLIDDQKKASVSSFGEKIEELDDLNDIQKGVQASGLPAEALNYIESELADLTNGTDVLREAFTKAEHRDQLLKFAQTKNGPKITQYLLALSIGLKSAQKESAETEDPPKPKPPKPPTPTGRNSTKTTRSVYDEDISYKEFVKLREAK